MDENTKKNVIEKAKNNKVEYVIQQAIKLLGIKVNRSKFLRKELIKYYSEEIVDLAIYKNPAYAGIEREN